MVQAALSSHQGWVVAVQWSSTREHQLLSGSYDSSLKYNYTVTCIYVHTLQRCRQRGGGNHFVVPRMCICKERGMFAY